VFRARTFKLLLLHLCLLVERFDASGKDRLFLFCLGDCDPDGDSIVDSTIRSIRDDFDMDEAIQLFLRKRHGVAVGESAAERIKIQLGSAYPAADAREIEIRGRELASGMPKEVVVTPGEIREILGETV